MKHKMKHFSGYFFAAFAITLLSSVSGILYDFNILPLLFLSLGVFTIGCVKIALRNAGTKSE